MTNSMENLRENFRAIKYSGFTEARMIRRLMDAIKQDRVPEIVDLIDNEQVEMNDRYKGLFISESAYTGNIEVIGTLISRGYDINANKGRPLQFAIENKDTTTINFLLDNGANIALLDTSRQDVLREMVTSHDEKMESSFIGVPPGVITRKTTSNQDYNSKPNSRGF